MAVKIRLKRMGKIRAPYYRIVVADSRTKRDGRVIEEIGKYHPKEDPSFIEVDSDRALYWLGVGAQPSEPVAAILKVTGDWQKFTGQAAPPPMLVAEPRRDKTEMFNEALKDSKHDPSAEAVTPRRQAAKKSPVEELKDLSDSEAGTAADTAAVEDAVTEAASSVAETAPLGSEDAAETAQEQDAPNGEMGTPDGASEALDGESDAPDGASDPNAAQPATADETDPAAS